MNFWLVLFVISTFRLNDTGVLSPPIVVKDCGRVVQVSSHSGSSFYVLTSEAFELLAPSKSRYERLVLAQNKHLLRSFAFLQDSRNFLFAGNVMELFELSPCGGIVSRRRELKDVYCSMACSRSAIAVTRAKANGEAYIDILSARFEKLQCIDLSNSGPNSIDFSSTGQVLAVGTYSEVSFWAIVKGQQKATKLFRYFGDGPYEQVKLFPGGDCCLFLNNSTVFKADIRGKTKSIVSTVAASGSFYSISTDGKLIAFAGSGKKVSIRDSSGTRVVWTTRGPDVPVRVISFSRDQRFLAVGYGNNEIWIWQLPARIAKRK